MESRRKGAQTRIYGLKAKGLRKFCNEYSFVDRDREHFRGGPVSKTIGCAGRQENSPASEYPAHSWR